MAKLGKPLEGFKIDYSSDKSWEEQERETRLKMEELLRGGKVISFPVADGYAYYLVESTSPSVILRHIPYQDGYEVSYLMIRGIRASDIQRYLLAISSLTAERAKGIL